ncbi:HlyIII-domain-containing protein [Obba rivulosa]|uniref:HlyIII-domain-containing protein n=1 Tax=Obba rivulosa TaxID=1052685 RepID=A0A8E2ALP3_9APHY|nr:HlyIII-domain-containing protein [Obba rivulosa]
MYLKEWQRDNEYILRGYRRSWRGCAASIFGFNIHTHLFGAILFLYLLFTFQKTYFRRYESVTLMDMAVFAIFLSSAVFCLFSSAFFHTFTAHSKEVSARCNAADYAGIVVLIVGSFFPCIYYGFYCDPHLQTLYLLLILNAGAGAAYIVLDPEYRKPTHRGARTKVFIALGLSAVIPVSHALISHGYRKLLHEMGFGWLLLSAFLYISGALLYAMRIPERLYPGKFDYFFASHQVFHVHVVLAALAHYACVLTAFDHWHSRVGECLA